MTVTGHEDEFRRLFTAEATARLDELDQLATGLRDGAEDPERLDTMFRQVHTIKGGAGVVGFFDLVPPADALGALVEALRTRGKAPDDGTTDAIVRGIGDLRERLAELTRDLGTN